MVRGLAVNQLDVGSNPTFSAMRYCIVAIHLTLNQDSVVRFHVPLPVYGYATVFRGQLHKTPIHAPVAQLEVRLFCTQ